MSTDNRTNEPTEAQIEAAAATIAVEELILWRKTWGDLSEGRKQDFRSIARATLVAAQEAAPVLSSSGVGEDALVQVLEAHRYKGMGWCECGENVNVRDGHRRHVARAVVAYLRGES